MEGQEHLRLSEFLWEKKFKQSRLLRLSDRHRRRRQNWRGRKWRKKEERPRCRGLGIPEYQLSLRAWLRVPGIYVSPTEPS